VDIGPKFLDRVFSDLIENFRILANSNDSITQFFLKKQFVQIEA